MSEKKKKREPNYHNSISKKFTIIAKQFSDVKEGDYRLCIPG